jgi:hypothetical protein
LGTWRFEKKLETVVGWRADFPAASEVKCEECKAERCSDELCNQCPFKKLPELDRETIEILQLWDNLASPFSMQMGGMNFVFEIYKPEMTRSEAMMYIQCINHLWRTCEKMKPKGN